MIALVIICIVAVVIIPAAALLLARGVRRKTLRRQTRQSYVPSRPSSWAQMRGRIDRRPLAAFSTGKNLGKHPNKVAISVGNLAKSSPETGYVDLTAAEANVLRQLTYSDGVPTHVHDAPAEAHCAPAEAPACDTSSSCSSDCSSSYDSGGGGFDSGGSCGGGDF
jgi:hypothetical protein